MADWAMIPRNRTHADRPGPDQPHRRRHCRQHRQAPGLHRPRQQQGATLVVFSELSLLGYPPKDLLLKSQFIADSLRALDEIARQVKGIDVIVGYADRNPPR